MYISRHSLGKLLLLLAASAAFGLPAQAGERTGTLWLSLPSCDTPPYDEAELQHALDVELAPRGLHAQLARSAALAGPRVSLSLSSCEPGAESVTLQISTAQARALADRSLGLREIEPAARARTLALLIVDALEPPRLPESAPSSPASTTQPERAAPPKASGSLRSTFQPRELQLRDDLLEREDPYPTPLGVRLSAAAHARLILRDSNTLYGIELSAAGHLAKRSEWVIEGSYSGGDTSTQQRDFNLQWYQASIGMNFITPSARSGLRFGPRMGLARVVGVSLNDFSQSSEDRAMLVTFGGRMDAQFPAGKFATILLAVDATDHIYERFFTEDGKLLPLYGLVLSWGLGVSIAL